MHTQVKLGQENLPKTVSYLYNYVVVSQNGQSQLLNSWNEFACEFIR